MLVRQCLMKQVTAKATDDDPDFKIPMRKLETLYTQVKAGCVD